MFTERLNLLDETHEILATNREVMARALASAIGFALRQSYEFVNGGWWLFTNSIPKRPLTESEVNWHKERNHKPFVSDGIDKESPDWWQEPIGKVV